MPRRGENIYKRKDGRWEGRFIKDRDLGGKAVYGYVYAKTYSEVKRALNIASRKTESLTESVIIRMSVQEVLTSWLEYKKLHVKESTFARYYQIVHVYLIPQLGLLDISTISVCTVEKLVHQLLSSGKKNGNGGLSTKSVNDILCVIKACVNYAKDNNYPVNCNLQHLHVKQGNSNMRILSVEEQKRLSAVLLSDIDLVKLGIMLSLYTGIRIGELCALKWEDINLDSGIMVIKHTLQRIKNTSSEPASKTKVITSEPKSRSSIREIPLPHDILELLQNYKGNEKAYVLTGEKNHYIEPRTIQNRFKSLLKEGGLPNVNYHVLRHTFATRCVEAGFELKSLSEILGHSSVNITLNRYVHSSIRLKQENMGKVKIYT